MPTQKPVVTAEHHERFQEIMKTPTRANLPTQNQAVQPSKVSALLASLPKPKGIGGKMFVFTGKKKIVLEAGGKQEVETVKTVDAKSETATLPNKEAPMETPKPETSSQNTKPAEVVKPKEDKKEVAKKGGFPKGILIVGLIVFLGAWALFWLYFLDFI